MAETPLFPLKTVLLPGNSLALKIFETRYVDMIAHCMREQSDFGVILIHTGEESRIDADIYSIGTTAKINDWEHRADGLLGITALGVQRFEILSTRTQSDGLTLAEIKFLEENDSPEVPDQYQYMEKLLIHISAQPGVQNDLADRSFVEVLYQLIYMLPLQTNLKQHLLEISDSVDRAGILHAELIRLGVIQYIKPESDTPGFN